MTQHLGYVTHVGPTIEHQGGLVIPGAVVLYVIVSTAIRVGMQFILFRKGTPEPLPSAIAVPLAR